MQVLLYHLEMLTALEDIFDRATKEPGANVKGTSQKTKMEGKTTAGNKRVQLNQMVCGLVAQISRREKARLRNGTKASLEA